MRCLDPYIVGKGAFACGRCVPCLKYRARVWSHRIVLESLLHTDNAFVTLTYEGNRERLDSSHSRDWLKRLRRRFAPLRFRYFLVGEYGERTQRPHYHAALFGYPGCGFGTVVNGACQCFSCIGVRETWGFGHVLVGHLSVKSANYISGYLLKARDPARIGFTRMSLKPGIGADAMWDVASELMRYRLKSAPLLGSGRSVRPLGRYLSKKLGEFNGEAGSQLVPGEAEVRAVREYAFAHGQAVKEVWKSVFDKGEVRGRRNEKI